MQKNNKSAKDIAFDKERAKFRSEIRALKYEIEQKNKQNQALNNLIHQKEEEISKLNEWIERLLEYTEIKKEDIKEIIENEKEQIKIHQCFSELMKISSIYNIGT